MPKAWLVYGMIFSVAFACIITLHRWHTGTTTSLMVAGALPVSDAWGYWACGHFFLGSQPLEAVRLQMQNDWCTRRAIYPNFLATLLTLSNWHLPTVLLWQGALIGLAIFSLCWAVVRVVGMAGSSLIFMLLFSFAAQHALALLMTEVVGLIAGTVALVLLLQGTHGGKSGLVFGGIALLSIGMVARAGAMLVLPAVFLWMATAVKVRGFRWVMALAGSGLALLAGFGLQSLLVVLNGF
jgi:hypothetical protein